MPLPELGRCRSALVVKPSSLGDIVHTLPAVHLIRRRWPHLRLAWLVNPEFAPLLAGNPDIDEVVPFPRRDFRGLAGLRRLLAWRRAFRTRPAPDVVLDFQGLLRSALVARWSRAPHIIGLTDSREGARFLHHHRIAVNAASHAVERNLTMARALGADGPVRFPLPEGDPPPLPAGQSLPDRFVLLHPFSRGAGKSLAPELVRQFCDSLQPLPVVLAGRTEETDRPGLPSHVTDLLNATTLPQLTWLMRRAAWTVSVDSGPMHMAAALSGNVLGLHTWSDPRRVGPWRPDAFVWKAGRLCAVRDLDSTAGDAGRPIAAADIPALATFVRKRLGT